MNRVRIIIVFVVISLFFYSINHFSKKSIASQEVKFWDFQSIDTMKYSRDIAREKMKDKSFDFIIDTQVKNIAQTGATHIAIATPYDEEFIPYLLRWVDAARRNNLKVWFRGNWSGWEGWFQYTKIDRKTHLQKTTAFIRKYSELFENGDIFTPCPECENGGPGDPRQTGDVKGFRDFLTDEYNATKYSFSQTGKKVKSNFASMNGDVARLIMDKDTTSKLDGLVVIDHYVNSTDDLIKDIREIANQSGGKVVLGEFGAPILDIHGKMTEDEQAHWIKDAFEKLVDVRELAGVNYWVNVGGSTELWNEKGEARKGVVQITYAYNPKKIIGIVKNRTNNPIIGAIVLSNRRRYVTLRNGYFFLPSLSSEIKLNITTPGYKSKEQSVIEGTTNEIVLEKQQKDPFFKLEKILRIVIPQP